jgi:hypothetical protein
MFSYLTSGNYDFRYDLSKGLRPRRAVRTAMQHELLMYSIVQKEGLGLDKAIEEVKHRMSRYSVTPNVSYALKPTPAPNQPKALPTSN